MCAGDCGGPIGSWSYEWRESGREGEDDSGEVAGWETQKGVQMEANRVGLLAFGSSSPTFPIPVPIQGSGPRLFARAASSQAVDDQPAAMFLKCHAVVQ